MTTWTNSHFLQALGWATLNSLWQMALLWAAFSFISNLFKLSAARKYQMAVGAILTGFVWFVATAVSYYLNNATSYALFQNTIVHNNNLLHVCLLSASVAYLFLLIFPAVRLLNNWRFVLRIQKEGQEKAQLEYRLFVQKVSFLLGIKKTVKVAVSHLVASPVTVGFLKPLILLPVASLNQLSPAQVEAVLLHELSHIRRYDFLLNMVVSFIHTLLYFNPFVKSFMNIIEAEREACCDEVVLQFGYNKVDYASALLHLEKFGGQHYCLTIAAAGKQHLLTRIEKIVGMEKKKTLKMAQIVPLFLSVFCVLLFNSVLIINEAGNGEAITYTNDVVFSPLPLTGSSQTKVKPVPVFESRKLVASQEVPELPDTAGAKQVVCASGPVNMPPSPPENGNIIPVNFDAVDGSLTKEEKDKVKTTVEATKKVASTLQWNEIEASIGDAMNQQEKAMARQEYLHELSKVDWQTIEQNLKANYEKLDWELIEQNMAKAMTQVQADSLHTVYAAALAEMEKAEKALCGKMKCPLNPLPDVSVNQLRLAKETLQQHLRELKHVTKQKKAVSL